METFLARKEMSRDSNNEKANVFGVNLRARVSSAMKMAAMDNGVFDDRIDTHSLRAGGETALYTQGVPLDVTQRWDRWKSLTSHQYLWHDASAVNNLSEVIVRPHGLLECLELMNKPNKQLRFQDNRRTMLSSEAPTSVDASTIPTSLSLPDKDSRAGGQNTRRTEDSDMSLFSPSELPPYTASPGDSMNGTMLLTNREKSEKLEKKEEGEPYAKDTTRAALFSGEEGVSSRPSNGSPSVVSRTACPYACFESDKSNSPGDTLRLGEEEKEIHNSRATRVARPKSADGNKPRTNVRHMQTKRRDHSRGRSGGRGTSWKEKERNHRRTTGNHERESSSKDNGRSREERRRRHRSSARQPRYEGRSNRDTVRRNGRGRHRISPTSLGKNKRVTSRISPTSNESDVDSAAASSSIPRVFLSKEYIENETGSWQKKLVEGETVVSEMDNNASNRKTSAPTHFLDNRAYAPITSDSLKER